MEMQQCIPFAEFSRVCTYKESFRTAQKMVLPIVMQQCISLVLFTDVELHVSDSNVKCVYFFSLSVRYFCPILSKLGFTVYFNTVLNKTIYNYLKGVHINSWQCVLVVHSTITRP